MPGVASWNGRWSGESEKYTKAINLSTKAAKKLIGHYQYSFGDGWRASVDIRKPTPRERVSNKFCGYEWMIDSIRVHGKIIA